MPRHKDTPMLDAQAAGKKRYFTGNPCPRGHVAERMVSTRACVACTVEKRNEDALAHPEKYAAAKRAYVSANTEKVKAWKSAEQKRNRAAANARNQRYAETHREELRVKNAAWAASNPGKVAARFARRRAAVLRATPAWADNDIITSMYELAAIYREHAGLDVHVDHEIPLQGKRVCGLHVHHNLQIIDAGLNRSKSNHFLVS